jgi:hypothetical protein
MGNQGKYSVSTEIRVGAGGWTTVHSTCRRARPVFHCIPLPHFRLPLLVPFARRKNTEYFLPFIMVYNYPSRRPLLHTHTRPEQIKKNSLVQMVEGGKADGSLSLFAYEAVADDTFDTTLFRFWSRSSMADIATRCPKGMISLPSKTIKSFIFILFIKIFFYNTRVACDLIEWLGKSLLHQVSWSFT